MHRVQQERPDRSQVAWPDVVALQVERDFLRDIPEMPGVYLFRDGADRVIYAGKAGNLRVRVNSYFWNTGESVEKIEGILERLHRIEYRVLGSDLEAVIEEYRLIDEHKPAFNTKLRVPERALDAPDRILIVPSAMQGMLKLYVLANALPLNGLNTGDISDRFTVYFVPAGYVFSIWGLIYVGLIAYAIFQALPAQRENPRLRAVGWWVVLSGLANSAWIFLWHYELFPITLVAMLILLISLIAIYLRLDIGRPRVKAAEKWFVDVPFSIYLGWITVATIANVTSLLEYFAWGGWGISNQIWALIILAVGVVVAGAVHLTRYDVAYMLVILWAFIGIAIKHSETSLVATGAWIASGLVFLLLVVGILFNRKRMSPPASLG